VHVENDYYLRRNARRVRHEQSCGIVAYREQPGQPRQYLLLQYPGGHWDFPKGHVEPGETETGTAKRELAEETGITEVSIREGFRETIRYRFQSADGQSVNKQVIFFTGRVDADRLQISHEHQGYEWLGYRPAKERLTFANARRLLQQVETFLAHS
jgi:bis(5'-nucleosidyl)-tetraphosphatase